MSRGGAMWRGVAWYGVAWCGVAHGGGPRSSHSLSLSLSFLPASLDLSFIVSLSVALLSLSLAPRHLSFALSASTALSITLDRPLGPLSYGGENRSPYGASDSCATTSLLRSCIDHPSQSMLTTSGSGSGV